MSNHYPHSMNLSRTLIIGNSGSGKSWLAKRLAEHLQVPWTDLDLIHWVSDEHSIARPRAEALGMARVAASEERWVIEGVYDWMLSELVEQATAMIWLCVEDEDCVNNIRQREAMRDDSDELLIALLEWAGSYRTREGASGFAAHQRLFEAFIGWKLQLMNRAEVSAFISAMQQTD
ncbi:MULTISPECIES: adenylate kinase [unclassified Pseudomonas]|uniref:adenylate kinase n=1 Tax=unclassified Pseudomonas TaxID=196821 RepID=UPI00215F7083|nr:MULTISPECIES: adenylate kinase [unclassified Pseudomonas]UVM51547.1 adenylate kinase [Pseudomonas sp. B21-015]WPN59079.1 adenylate kinase [Pseudomonas sp. P9_31]